MYRFCLNSLYRISPAHPELPLETSVITTKTPDNRLRHTPARFQVTSAGNPEAFPFSTK